MTKPRFRQVLLSFTRDRAEPCGWRTQLEVLKVGQKGPRRSGDIRGEGAALCSGEFRKDPEAAPLGVVLDWLEDHPERVEGLPPDDVLAAVEEVRPRGGWFVRATRGEGGGS